MNLEISTLTDKYIQRYQEEISKKYKNVNMETLKSMWMNLNIQNPIAPVKLDKKKKKSSYQNFFGIVGFPLVTLHINFSGYGATAW